MSAGLRPSSEPSRARTKSAWSTRWSRRERNLGSGQARLGQFDLAVQSGIDTLGLDLHQSVNEASLLIERSDLLVHRGQLNVVECRIQDDLLAGVFQLELREPAAPHEPSGYSPGWEKE